MHYDPSTINNNHHHRLQFPQGQLYGRRNELRRLFDVCRSLCNSSNRTTNTRSTSHQTPNDDGINNEDSNTDASSTTRSRSSSSTSSNMAAMVLISGYSGTGKSSLVEEFRRQVQRDAKKNHHHPCWFIRGAYENVKTDPYSAIVQAISSYCEQLLVRVRGGGGGENDDDSCPEEEDPLLHRVRAGIREAVGNEGKILTDLIPPLKRIVGEQPAASTCSSSKNSVNRLRFLFQSFVEVICSSCCCDCDDDDRHGTCSSPLILFLDDVQRADAASLDLISALMTTPTLGNKLMFVCAFRSNEVDEHHPLTLALQEMERKRRKVASSSTTIRISVENLSVEAMNLFLSDTLRLEPEETVSLAETVHRKTEGNIFYAMQSLEQLNDRRALRYDSHSAFRWVKLPLQLQKALSIASFFRSSFDLPTIQDFMENHNNLQNTKSMSLMMRGESSSLLYYYDYDLVELLDMAVEERLLENQMGSETYKFSHDKIQQAAHSLVPATAVPGLKKQVGKYLESLAFTTAGEEWMMFVAADHLNATATLPHCEAEAAAAGAGAIEEEAVSLARLNLTVGQKAVSIAAFIPATQYFISGLTALERLTGSSWQTHYELTLELHRAASNLELSIGDFDNGWSLAHQLLENARTVLERIPTYTSLAEALSKRERYAEAMDLLIEALDLLGEFPKGRRLCHIIKNFRFIRKAFGRHTDEEILGLTKMTEPGKLAAMDILADLGHRAYMVQNMALAVLVNTTQLRMLFQVGLCGSFAPVLSGYGLILCGRFRDHAGARRMGKLARKILADCGTKRSLEAITLHSLAIWIDPWFDPLSSVMETLYAAHQSGMKHGDFEIGFRSFFHYQAASYAAGMPLGQIDDNGVRMIQLMDQYNVDSVRATLDQLRVLILTLSGRRRPRGNGADIDHDGGGDWRDPYEPPDGGGGTGGGRNRGSIFGRAWYLFTRMQLAYFFEEIALADEISEMAIDFVLGEKKEKSFIFVSHTLYFAALIAMRMARLTGKRKYWVRLRKLRKDMKAITSTRGLNILHKYYVLEAQYLTLILRNNKKRNNKKREGDVQAAFDKAISASSKAGFRQDSAIASELAGEYFLRAKNNFWARHYLSHAYQEYKDWGANAKAEHLLQKHDRGCVETVGCHSSTVLKRRHAIQGDACDKHRSVNLDSLSSRSCAITASSSSHSGGTRV